jgi:hypothetical protein
VFASAAVRSSAVYSRVNNEVTEAYIRWPFESEEIDQHSKYRPICHPYMSATQCNSDDQEKASNNRMQDGRKAVTISKYKFGRLFPFKSSWLATLYVAVVMLMAAACGVSFAPSAFRPAHSPATYMAT